MVNTFLAFDFGTKRTGLAVGNDLLYSTQPLAAIPTRQFLQVDGKINTDAIRVLIREWKINQLIFGIPLNAEGDETTLSKRIRKIGNSLARQLDLPVDFVDERFSSGEADRVLRSNLPRGKKFKTKQIALRDSVAAELILQTYFSALAPASAENGEQATTGLI